MTPYEKALKLMSELNVLCIDNDIDMKDLLEDIETCGG